MPVAGSTDLDKVSTATTCGDFSFHGEYFCQLPVETSSHEYSNSFVDEKTFISGKPDIGAGLEETRAVYRVKVWTTRDSGIAITVV